MINEKEKSCVIVGVAGGSGAGKTTIAKQIYEGLGAESNVLHILHDNYYKDISHLTFAQRANTNFDHPDSLDTDLLVQHLIDLRCGKKVYIPNYDFSTHSRTKDKSEVFPMKIILVEGILLFQHKELVDLLDIKIFVDSDSDIRFMRRMKRDCKERSRSYQDVIDQYTKTVRPMHFEFVEPSKIVADFIISNNFDVNKKAVEIIVNHLKVEAGMLGDEKNTSN